MTEQIKYGNTMVSSRADQTLTYTKYVRDEATGKSAQEQIDEISKGKVNKTDKLETGQIADGAITEEKLDDRSVTNAKLEADSVSYDKLQDGSVITRKIKDGNVTTEKVADKNITNQIGRASCRERVFRAV